MAVDRESEDYVQEIAGRMERALGDALVGVYLHGSLAMDAFVPTRSDVDILVVTTRPPTKDEKRTVAEALTDPLLRCPGVGLEVSVVTRDAITEPTEAPPFELHVATGEDAKTVDGEGHPRDEDLVAHLAMCRARGRTLVGPPPAEVITPVPKPWLLRSLAEDMTWALQRGLAGYAVLNACRGLRFLEEDVLCSKLEGGEWALQRLEETQVVRVALRRQRGEDVEVDLDAARRFVDPIRDRLSEAAA